MKHTLYEAKFEPYEIDVPEVCPRCGADFTAEGALSEGNWNDCTVTSHMETQSTQPEISGEDETKYLDTYYPIDLMCTACEWLLFVEDGEPKTVEDMIAGVEFAKPEEEPR